MPRNVIIIGMARSGTSAIAAIFARRGYYMGDSREEHIREGDSHNPFGYFEADDVIDMNVEVLRRVGYEHHNTWLFEQIPASAIDEIRNLTPTYEHRRFVDGYNQRSPWLWKDPRLCFTLPYWWKLMSPAKTGVVVVRREPLHVYRSFRRMGWCPPGEAARRALIELVEQHVAAAMTAAEGLAIPHMSVDYADFKRAPDALACRISELFDIEVSVEDLNVRPDLDHSTPQGRIATAIRLQTRRLPRKFRRRIEMRVPERFLAALFRERKYLKQESSGNLAEQVLAHERRSRRPRRPRDG
jgi:hypothetical protein